MQNLWSRPGSTLKTQFLSWVATSLHTYPLMAVADVLLMLRLIRPKLSVKIPPSRIPMLSKKLSNAPTSLSGMNGRMPGMQMKPWNRQWDSKKKRLFSSNIVWKINFGITVTRKYKENYDIIVICESIISWSQSYWKHNNSYLQIGKTVLFL